MSPQGLGDSKLPVIQGDKAILQELAGAQLHRPPPRTPQQDPSTTPAARAAASMARLEFEYASGKSQSPSGFLQELVLGSNTIVDEVRLAMTCDLPCGDLMVRAWLAAVTSACCLGCGGMGDPDADFDLSGVVDAADLGILLSLFGS